MKKVVSFLIALGLFVLSVTSIGYFMDSNIIFEPHDFGGWINEAKFNAKDEIEMNMNENTILVLGSSEFRHGRMLESHPIKTFKDKKFNMMMIGAGYYQSLYHATQLASLSGAIKNKKVVLILSPQWFKKAGVLPTAYASRFSETNFIAMLRNKKVSKETKEYIIKRSEILLKDDAPTLSRVRKYTRVYVTGDASFADKQYVRFYERFLTEKTKFQLYTAAHNVVPELDKKKKYQIDEPKWSEIMTRAEHRGKMHADGNPFFISDRVYRQAPLYKKKRETILATNERYDQSPEYGDLEHFLKVCKETGIEPMLVMVPFNGYWYDYRELSQEKRQMYYTKIRTLASKYNATLGDFSKDEHIKYYFIDSAHLGWKGWVNINESIYDFATEDKKQ